MEKFSIYWSVLFKTLVLNQADTDDFQFDDDNITKIHKCLDEVE